MANKPLKTLNFGGEDTFFLKPDWDKIDDKPFGETTVGGDTLTWDGNTEGLVNMECDGLILYKISDATPSYADVSDGITVSFAGEELATSSFIDSGLGILVDSDSVSIWIVHESAVGVDIDGFIPPETGFYVTGEWADMALTFTINGYTGFPTTKLKKEYLPVDYIRQLIAEVTGQ